MITLMIEERETENSKGITQKIIYKYYFLTANTCTRNQYFSVFTLTGDIGSLLINNIVAATTATVSTLTIKQLF